MITASCQYQFIAVIYCLLSLRLTNCHCVHQEYTDRLFRPRCLEISWSGPRFHIFGPRTIGFDLWIPEINGQSRICIPLYWLSFIFYELMFRPITEEEFFDAVEEELDKRDQMEQESNESNRLKQQAAGQQAVTPNEHHSQSIGLDFKIRVRILYYLGSVTFLRCVFIHRVKFENFLIPQT